MKRESSQNYNQLKKDKRALRREKIRRGWERFKGGFGKVVKFGKNIWDVGKKIAGGVGKVAAFA